MTWFSTGLSTRLKEVERDLHDLAHVIEQLGKASAPATISAELADIRQAMEVDRAALRRSLGKIWGTIGRAASEHVSDEEIGEDLQAMLDLQHRFDGGA